VETLVNTEAAKPQAVNARHVVLICRRGVVRGPPVSRICDSRRRYR